MLRTLYALKTRIQERWTPCSAEVYVLDMPLTCDSARPQEGVMALGAAQTPSTSALLAAFAREREAEDPTVTQYAQELERRFAQGDTCYAALCDGALASVVFASPRDYYIWELKYLLRLPPRTVMLYDVYTLTRFRGRSLYTAAFRYCVETSAQAGYQTAWVCILPDNPTSFRVHRRLGVTHVRQKVTMRQSWGLRWRRSEILDVPVEALGFV